MKDINIIIADRIVGEFTKITEPMADEIWVRRLWKINDKLAEKRFFLEKVQKEAITPIDLMIYSNDSGFEYKEYIEFPF